ADADNKAVTWTSSDTNVATVDSTGKVTAVGKGTAVITVSTEDGNFTATCDVTVEEHIAVTGVTLDHAELTLEKGTDAQLTATVEPADADNKAVTWTSSDTNVAAVDSTGKVTAVGKGTAVITVTTADGEFAASCRVTVEETIAVTSVLLNKTELILTKDEKYTLIVGVLPANATNQNVTWTSDHPEIASVDENGTVTGVTDGTAVITVTTEDGNFTVHCNVTVSSTVTRSFEFDYSSYEWEEIEAYYHETSEVSFTYTINGKAGDPSELTFAFEDTEHHVGEIKLSDDNSKLLITPDLIGYFGLVVKYHDEIIQRAYMNAYGPVYNFRAYDPNDCVLWKNVQPEALEISYTFDNAEGDYSSLTLKSSDESVLKAEFSEDHKTVYLTPVSTGNAEITFYAPWSADAIEWRSFTVKEQIQETGKYLSVSEWDGIEEVTEASYERLEDRSDGYSHNLYYYLFVDGVQQDSSGLSIISSDPSVVELGPIYPEEHFVGYRLAGFGTAEIQFRDGEELLKTITVTNTQPYISSVSVFSETYVLSAGSTDRLRYTLYPSYAKPAERVEYVSDNTNVVTVDESGLMTGVSEGRAGVTVKLYQENGYTVTESVSVTVSSDTITGYGSGNYPYVNAASLVSGEGNQFTLTFKDGYPKNIADGFKISVYLMSDSDEKVLYVSAFKPVSTGSSYTFDGTDLKKYASDNLEPGNYAVKIKLTKSYNEEMYYFPVMTIDQRITVKAPEDLVIKATEDGGGVLISCSDSEACDVYLSTLYEYRANGDAAFTADENWTTIQLSDSDGKYYDIPGTNT
ncbi:MAG: Ig-like domain-containing protein, partial [Erysipelotrichaceae bacterium]|nr:Ig-like domain-containing protein [Erysipelotrichaceae bacterium]